MINEFNIVTFVSIWLSVFLDFPLIYVKYRSSYRSFLLFFRKIEETHATETLCKVFIYKNPTNVMD